VEVNEPRFTKKDLQAVFRAGTMLEGIARPFVKLSLFWTQSCLIQVDSRWGDDASYLYLARYGGTFNILFSAIGLLDHCCM
jgi:hypothetical protein